MATKLFNLEAQPLNRRQGPNSNQNTARSNQGRHDGNNK